jgi:hypothetical protein
VWAAEDTYRIFDTPVRVRSTAPTFAEAVRALLQAYPAAQDAPVQAVYSAVIEPPRRDTIRPVHRLYGPECGAVRAADPLELLAALSEGVSYCVWRRNGEAAEETAPDALLVRGGAAAWDGQAVLLLPLGDARPYTLWQRLFELGFRYLADAVTRLGPAGGTALPFPKGALYAPEGDWPLHHVVWSPRRAVPWRARWQERRLGDDLVSGPCPVRWLIWLDRPADGAAPVEPLARSTALALLLQHTTGWRRRNAAGFQALVRTVAAAQCLTVRAQTAAEAAALVRQVCAAR